MSLFWRIFALNAAVLSAATMVLLFGPITISTPVLLTETAILVGGLAVMLVTNALVLRTSLVPLRRLARVMTTTDLLQPVDPALPSARGEVADLVAAFSAMVRRLRGERAASAARALHAQEAERHRVARELHDEVGQTLTAVVLDLDTAVRQASGPLSDDLGAVRETARGSLEEVRRIVRRLRPGVLEELGLASALRSLAAEHTSPGLVVQEDTPARLLNLPGEVELVVYRVAQESLTNTVRHARATRVRLTVRAGGDRVELRVADDGRGTHGAPEGAGIAGMRERARLAGADLTLTSRPGEGTEVRLTVPVRKEDAAR